MGPNFRETIVDALISKKKDDIWSNNKATSVEVVVGLTKLKLHISIFLPKPNLLFELFILLL